MKYSVIVPYYKAEKHLRRCCDSLMAQKGDFEFLLISDETDADSKSDDIAREYVSKDERFVVIWNQHEKGVSGARNTGLDHVKGDWVDCFYPTDEPTCYLFGDVVFSPDAIRTIVRKQTNDVELFGSAEPFAQDYPKKHVEPFAFKVVNTEHFRRAIQMAKKKRNESWRTPIAWELWSLIKGRRIDIDDYRADYTIINDYTCDVDTASDLKKFVHIGKIKLE